jgi:hypothetical protein
MSGKSLEGPDIGLQGGGSREMKEMIKLNSRATALLGAALLIAPIVALGATVPVGAGAASAPRVLTCSERFASKPSNYIISCADANAGWTGVTWSSWTASSASGHGFLHQNDCTPNCASGKFIDYRANLTLSKVVTTKKYGRLFSSAVFHYTVNGVGKTEQFDLNV